MTLTLTPFSSTDSLVDGQGRPTMQFQNWLQNALQRLYDEVGALAAAEAAQSAAEAANTAAGLAQTAADNANTAAGTAQGAADQVAADAGLASSGTVGATLTATDIGASVTVAVSAHTRVYGDGVSVAVGGGSVTGLAYASVYYIHYLDPSRAGGAVTYLASTDPADAVQSGDVHSVGAVTTPAPAGAPLDGVPWYASGIPYY
jgi:hypothetical protein